MVENWRAHFSQESRNQIVNRVMDTLQTNSPLSGEDGMTELWKIAKRFEEKIFYAASDQHDYLRKISLKMLNLETRTQDALNGAVRTSSSGTIERPLDSGITQVQSWQQAVQPAQAGTSNNGIQVSAGGSPASSFSSINNVLQPAPFMNSLGQVWGNLPALNGGSPINNMSGGLPASHSQSVLLASQQRFAQLQQLAMQQQRERLQQQVGSGDSLQQVGQPGGIDEADIVWSKMQTLKDKYLQDMKDLYIMITNRSQQHMPEEQLQKLIQYKNVLQRMMPYLIASKGSLPKEFKQDKVEAFEKHIVSIMETFKRWKQVAPQPQQPELHCNLGQAQAVQQPQLASQNLQPDNKPVQQQTPVTAQTELQASNASFPFLQSSFPLLPQAIGVATQPTPCNSLTNAVQSGYPSLPQAIGVATQPTPLNSLANAVQMNVLGMQEDRQFHENQSLKCQEQSQRFQVWYLQQHRQQLLQLFYVFVCMLIFTFCLLFIFCGSMTTRGK